VKIETHKLDKDMNGPNEFAIVSEQRLIEMGYVWAFWVTNDNGEGIRVGVSKIKDEAKLRRYIESGMNRIDWEAIHGKD
jgi:hypothetical protein